MWIGQLVFRNLCSFIWPLIRWTLYICRKIFYRQRGFGEGQIRGEVFCVITHPRSPKHRRDLAQVSKQPKWPLSPHSSPVFISGKVTEWLTARKRERCQEAKPVHFLGSLCSSPGCYSIRHSGADLQLHTASSVSVTGSLLAPGPCALTSIYRMLLICAPPLDSLVRWELLSSLSKCQTDM